jgi:DnaA family protein
MRALAAQRQAAGERVGWFDAKSAPPGPVDESWSLVLLDDCQALDAGQQQAAFAVFVDTLTRGVQVVAAGRLPPVDLPVREDLRTRLGWGHVFALQPLAESEARAALRREADRRGIFLSDEVMDYLLTRFERDLKHLMRLLERLDRFALAQQRGITVPLLKSMLAEEGL